jgi:nucleoid-associated protein YgaU
MGLFDFVRNAGAKIFNRDRDDDEGKLSANKGLSGHLREHGIDPSTMKFTFQGDTVVVEGTVPTQEAREKAILIIGNVEGVGRVDDRLRVGSAVPTTPSAASVPLAGAQPAGSSQTIAHKSPGESTGWVSRTYTVEKGDTLSGIAKKMYGNANKYPQIFEANKPMLKDPDKIYPGQVLRIPPEA